MKLLILGMNPELPSTRYRATQLIEPLENKGLEVEFNAIPSAISKRLKLFNKCSDFDVVLLQKKLFQPWEFFLLRKKCQKLVFDLDDSIMFRQSKENFRSIWRQLKFSTTIKNSDHVIAGNELLAYRCLEYNSEVKTIPTVIDLNRYKAKKWGDDNSDFTLGWIGTKVNLHYLDELRPALENIGSQISDIKLKIICDDFLDFENLKVEKINWKYETEIQHLQSFDVSLMPLNRDVWSLGKCGFKLIQSMAVGVPVICTPVGINREIVINNFNGFWANILQEWEHKIIKCHSIRNQLEEIGGKARKHIVNNFSIDAVINKYISLFNKITP